MSSDTVVGRINFPQSTTCFPVIRSDPEMAKRLEAVEAEVKRLTVIVDNYEKERAAAAHVDSFWEKATK